MRDPLTFSSDLFFHFEDCTEMKISYENKPSLPLEPEQGPTVSTRLLRSEPPDSFSVFVIGHCHTKGSLLMAAVLVQSGRTIPFRLPPRLYRRRST